MFESSPQTKIAIGYSIKKANGQLVFLVMVYSIVTQKFVSILSCEQEVSQICTNGTTDILIVGTVMGSLYLYDLNNLNTNPNQAMHYNYEAMA